MHTGTASAGAAVYNRTSAEAGSAAMRGTNQSHMRDHNERLVLGLLRKHGALTKSEITRITGLSAQTISVIVRSLEEDGLLLRGEPIRGRIGQPSVPMSLAPEGAWFVGLKIGRKSTEMVLVDFAGVVRAVERFTHPYPEPDTTLDFVGQTLPRLLAGVPLAQRWRVTGIGVAMPLQLWTWAEAMGAPQAAMDGWRQRDIVRELTLRTGLSVSLQNDATSACGAELVFGKAELPADFLYFYFGTFIGGGLVLNGQLFLGRTGNAAGVGSIPVPIFAGDGQRLFDRASFTYLANRLAALGHDGTQLWDAPETWSIPAPLLQEWIDNAAEGLALVSLSVSALLEIEAVLIDGSLPTTVRAAIVAATQRRLRKMDLSGLTPFTVREGTLGALARPLGAAAIPLSQRFLVDHNAAQGAA